MSRGKGGHREDLLDLARTALQSAEAVPIVFDDGIKELRHIVKDLEKGDDLPNALEAMLARGSPNTRRELHAAAEAYERDVMRFRARLLQLLVDEEGYSLTELAAMTGVSRQRVAAICRMSQGGDRYSANIPATEGC
ncbi:MAG: hypothetical protein ABR598_04630 [Candidatus Dormibacteria bacterium]